MLCSNIQDENNTFYILGVTRLEFIVHVQPSALILLVAAIEWLSLECSKIKTKVITVANHNGHDNTVNQSELEEIAGS